MYQMVHQLALPRSPRRVVQKCYDDGRQFPGQQPWAGQKPDALQISGDRDVVHRDAELDIEIPLLPCRPSWVWAGGKQCSRLRLPSSGPSLGSTMTL